MKYKVTIGRTVYFEATVEVEADNDLIASDLAEDLAEKQDNFEYLDTSYELVKVEEAE